eukprot:gene20028-123_t
MDRDAQSDCGFLCQRRRHLMHYCGRWNFAYRHSSQSVIFAATFERKQGLTSGANPN